MSDAALAGARLLADPQDWRQWGIYDGALCRQVSPNQVEYIAPEAIIAALLKESERADASRRESLIDRSHQLLITVLGAGVMQATDPAGAEEIARDCVRIERALDEEVAQATPRPEPKQERPRSQRAVGPQKEEELPGLEDPLEGWNR